MDKLRVFFLVLFSVLCQLTIAQDYSIHAIDSLKVKLKQTTLQKSKGDLLISISKLYLENQLDSAKVYIARAQKLITDNNYDSFNLSLLKINESLAFENYKQARSRLDSVKATILKTNTSNKILKLNYLEVKYFTKTREFRKSIKLIDTTLKAYAYLKTNTIADLYVFKAYSKSNILLFDEVLLIIEKAKSIYERTNNQIGLNDCYQKLVFLYLSLKDFDLALEYANKLSLNANHLKSRSTKIGEKIVLGMSYFSLEKYNKAVKEFEYALDLNSRLNIKSLNAWANMYLNRSNINTGNFKAVIDHSKKLLLNAETTSNKYELYNHIVTSYNKLNQFQDAEVYLKKMKAIVNPKKSPAKRQVFIFLEAARDTEHGLGNHLNAYKYSEEYISKYTSYTDSINSEILLKHQVRFETKEKDLKLKDLELKNQEEKLNTLKASQERNVLFYVLGCSALFIVLGFYFYNRLKHHNRLLRVKNHQIQTDRVKIQNLLAQQTKLSNSLEDSNTTIQKTFSIIAHDLRNPFNALLSYSNLLVEDFYTLSEDEKLTYAKTTRKLAEDNYNLTQNLLAWSLKQHLGYSVNKKYTNLYTVIDKSTQSLSGFIASKKGQVQNDVEAIQVLIDEEIILTIVNNLLTNAIKSSNPDTSIVITSQINDTDFSVNIYNEGHILCEEKTVYINDYLSNKVEDEQKHNFGLGFNIVKEMATLHNAKISFDSKGGHTNVTLTVVMDESA